MRRHTAYTISLPVALVFATICLVACEQEQSPVIPGHQPLLAPPGNHSMPFLALVVTPDEWRNQQCQVICVSKQAALHAQPQLPGCSFYPVNLVLLLECGLIDEVWAYSEGPPPEPGQKTLMGEFENAVEPEWGTIEYYQYVDPGLGTLAVLETGYSAAIDCANVLFPHSAKASEGIETRVREALLNTSP